MAEENSMARGSSNCPSNEAQEAPAAFRTDSGGECWAADFAQRDAIERAVRDLTGVGLLFRSDGLVLPTRAALRFNEILGEGM
jgi:hypothetical protein